MAAFMSKLRADLAAGGIFAPVTIACADPPCTAGNTPPAALIEAAKQAGARLLVYGGGAKKGTPQQWGKVPVFDLAAHRLLDDKKLAVLNDTGETLSDAQ